MRSRSSDTDSSSYNSDDPKNSGSHRKSWFAAFHRWTIRRRIVAAFGFIVLLVALQTAISVSKLRMVNRSAATLGNDTLPGLVAVAQIQRNAGEIQIALLRALLSGDPEKAKEQRIVIEGLSKDNDRLAGEYEATVFQEADRQQFEALKALRARYSGLRNQVLNLADEGKREEALQLNAASLRSAFDEYKKALDGLLAYNVDEGQRLRVDIVTSAAATLRVVALAGALVLVVSVGAALLIIVGLTRILSRLAQSLDEGSAQVAAASLQVSRSSQTLAEGASEQASSLEETSSSLEELASMTKRNTDSTASANALAREARQAADSGASDMQTMSSAMMAIKASGDDIAKIVKTIDEIAFQTNILALNAAVEAARAGAAGAGFAVVADEVRALAQRSAQSAKETAEKIEGTIARTSQGVAMSEKVSAGLVLIVDKVRKVDDLVSEVSAASAEQSQGVEQINAAVGQMDKVVQSSASNAEETAAAAEELSAQAASMRDAVSELVALVRGNKAADSRAGGRSGRDAAEVSPPIERTRPEAVQLLRRGRPTAPEKSRSAGLLPASELDRHFR